MAAVEAPPARKSDLGVRTVSALVMVAIAGAALWFGGIVWSLFAVAIMIGVLWEWRCLIAGITVSPVKRGLSNAAGIAYVGFATWILVVLRMRPDGIPAVLTLVGLVVAVDVFAYFFGRTIGGPKIASAISPSKTWAGLAGGVLGATLIFALGDLLKGDDPFSDANYPELHGVWYLGKSIFAWLILGLGLAITAQTGDFFESWLKRRAGVKDSSHLIPGHGGLFDRLDGLLAVSFVLGIILLLSGGLEGIS